MQMEGAAVLHRVARTCLTEQVKEVKRVSNVVSQKKSRVGTRLARWNNRQASVGGVE